MSRKKGRGSPEIGNMQFFLSESYFQRLSIKWAKIGKIIIPHPTSRTTKPGIFILQAILFGIILKVSSIYSKFYFSTKFGTNCIFEEMCHILSIYSKKNRPKT